MATPVYTKEHCVLVRGIPPTCDKRDLQVHFMRKRSGGEENVEVVLFPSYEQDKDTAIIIFADPHTAAKVLRIQRQVTGDGFNLLVEPPPTPFIVMDVKFDKAVVREGTPEWRVLTDTLKLAIRRDEHNDIHIMGTKWQVLAAEDYLRSLSSTCGSGDAKKQDMKSGSVSDDDAIGNSFSGSSDKSEDVAASNKVAVPLPQGGKSGRRKEQSPKQTSEASRKTGMKKASRGDVKGSSSDDGAEADATDATGNTVDQTEPENTGNPLLPVGSAKRASASTRTVVESVPSSITPFPDDDNSGSSDLPLDRAAPSASGDNLSRMDTICAQPGPYDLTSTKIRIKKADITKLEVDAIVNPVGQFVGCGGQLARLIAKEAGPGYQKEMKHLQENNVLLKEGDSRITSGYRLGKHVIHVRGPTPDWRSSGLVPARRLSSLSFGYCQSPAEVLQQAVTTVLKKADMHSDIETIAIPSISTGDLELSAEALIPAIVKAVVGFKATTLKQIYLVDINKATVKVFQTEYYKLC